MLVTLCNSTMVQQYISSNRVTLGHEPEKNFLTFIRSGWIDANLEYISPRLPAPTTITQTGEVILAPCELWDKSKLAKNASQIWHNKESDIWQPGRRAGQTKYVKRWFLLVNEMTFWCCVYLLCLVQVWKLYVLMFSVSVLWCPDTATKSAQWAKDYSRRQFLFFDHCKSVSTLSPPTAEVLTAASCAPPQAYIQGWEFVDAPGSLNDHNGSTTPARYLDWYGVQCQKWSLFTFELLMSGLLHDMI